MRKLHQYTTFIVEVRASLINPLKLVPAVRPVVAVLSGRVPLRQSREIWFYMPPLEVLSPKKNCRCYFLSVHMGRVWMQMLCIVFLFFISARLQFLVKWVGPTTW